MKTIYIVFITLLIFSSKANAHAEISKECHKFMEQTKDYEKIEGEKEGEERRAISHIKRSFLWENDSFLKNGAEDRHYTNGMKLTWVYNPCKNKHDYLKVKFKEVLNSFSDKNRELHTAGVFGMNMYTPNSITDPNRNINDRPYAGCVIYGVLTSIKYNR